MATRRVEFNKVKVTLVLGPEPSLIVDGIECPVDRETALKLLFGEKNIRKRRLEELPKTKNGRRKPNPSKSAAISAGIRKRNAARTAKGMCTMCERKVVPGKKICPYHLSILKKRRKGS